MLSLVKTFNKIFKFKSFQAWNAIYIFKIAIYALGFIDFDTPLNLLVFLLLCLQIRQKQVNLIYRIFISRQISLRIPDIGFYVCLWTLEYFCIKNLYAMF